VVSRTKLSGPFFLRRGAAELRQLMADMKKKKPKKNPHCPVPGCKTKQPHLSSPITVGLHHVFSDSERLALWVKSCIVELVQSVIDDVNKGRYFAYLTRWRQPEEMYHRALYMLFVADQAAIPHIVSGELPNSFSDMWKAVNKTVFDGKGTLDQKQPGLSGEEFTAMNTLNNSAHASFATIITCVDFARKPELKAPIIDKHIEYWKILCNNLDGKHCPDGCRSQTLHVRSAEECEIPATLWAQKASDEGAFHCFHCDLIWFQSSGLYARKIGHYRGGEFRAMEPETFYVKPVEKKQPAHKVGTKRNYKRH
jgi:hypothetical protein